MAKNCTAAKNAISHLTNRPDLRPLMYVYCSFYVFTEQIKSYILHSPSPKYYIQKYDLD